MQRAYDRHPTGLDTAWSALNIARVELEQAVAVLYELAPPPPGRPEEGIDPRDLHELAQVSAQTLALRNRLEALRTADDR